MEQVESYRAAYSGFFNVNSCNNILIYDCEIFCHKDSYYTNNKNEKVLLGSYELSAKYVNNVTYDNVIQTNFFTNEEKTQILDQGLMGTNYCKNMHVKNSRFARFDTHCGVYNLTVTNSELQRINVTGSGTVKIEDTIFWGNYLTNLRNDYGGLFDGDFYFKNITVKYSGDKRISLFSTKWYNHDFGFTVIYPQNVYIDNLKVESGAKMYLFSTDLDWKPDLTADTVNGSENLNQIVPVKLVEIKSNPHGTEFVINTGDTFKDTKLEFAE